MSLPRKYVGIITFVAISVLVLLAGCSKGSSTATTSTQIVAVQRGNISNSITGTGNLALAKTADLAFDITGTVLDINVEEGATVSKGDILASLDTSQWEEQLKVLENAVKTAERNLRNAKRQITARDLGIRQAELDLRSSQETALSIPVVKSAQLEVDNAKKALDDVLANAIDDPSLLSTTIPSIQQHLVDAQRNLKTILSGSGYSISNDVALQIARTQLSVEQSQRQLEDAQIAAEDAVQARDDAAQALTDAQENLTEARSFSPLIVAPFDGFITKIDVSGGDEVKKGQLAMQIAEPDKFEADILVGENDIFQVSLDSTATVQVDALSGTSLPAKVTYIAPTATSQQGVVNYGVRVEVQSIDFSKTPPVQPGLGSSDNTSIANITERFKEAVKQGKMTQEQAEQMLKQMEDGKMGQGSFGTPGSGVPINQFAQSSSANTSLKQGLSVTVNIVTSQKQDVLMVPSDAILRKASGSVVTVRKNGLDEQRTVITGISDWQYTEIVSGLQENEEVVINRSSSSSNKNGMSQFGFPGGQRVVVR